MPKRPGIEAGAVFLVPLSDGRAGLCRVLEATPAAARVLTAAWIGPAGKARAVLAREVLRLTHHGQRGRPHVFLTHAPRPPRFTRLGTLAPTPEELALPAKAGAWESCALQLAAQWAWDHDRDAVRARDRAGARARRAALEAARRAEAEKAGERRRTARAAPPVDPARCAQALAKLARKRWFASWRASVSAEAIAGARAIVTDLIANAIARPRGRAGDRRALASAARAFDRLDAEHGFVGTLEAESIHEALVACGEACGLDRETCAATIDGARSW